MYCVNKGNWVYQGIVDKRQQKVSTGCQNVKPLLLAWFDSPFKAAYTVKNDINWCPQLMTDRSHHDLLILLHNLFPLQLLLSRDVFQHNKNLSTFIFFPTGAFWESCHSHIKKEGLGVLFVKVAFILQADFQYPVYVVSQWNDLIFQGLIDLIGAWGL